MLRFAVGLSLQSAAVMAKVLNCGVPVCHLLGKGAENQLLKNK